MLSIEFKQLAAEALATIRGEPGTLQHDWFFSDDGAWRFRVTDRDTGRVAVSPCIRCPA